MRRKWPVAAAAIPLAFGWALVAAHPAAASTRAGLPGPGAQVQPGGPSGADLSSAEAIAEAPSGTSGTSSVLPLTNFGSVNFTGVTANGKSLDTLDPMRISMPDTSVGDMASDGSFAVNYTGTGYAQWFGF